MRAEAKKEKKDIFQQVTDEIIEAIEAGTESYRMPWKTSGGFPYSPINAVSKKPYRGINILVLWAIAQKRGYTSGTWATFKQWTELGAQVRKGEKSAHVVFWKFFDNDDQSENDGETSKSGGMIARDYSIFNADQVDGYEKPEDAKLSRAERIEDADAFFRTLGVVPQSGGNQAYYCKDSDSVHMPVMEAFREPLFYYSVLSHETTHWSGAPHRLNRDLSGRFHTDSYAMEELIAELGAAFLCSELGLPTDPREDHAPYVA